MSDLTLASLDARLAVVEAKLGIAPLPVTPPPVIPPGGGSGGGTSPTAKLPADVFGKNWKLTLPINGAQEIEQPALATYTSKYCELTADGSGVVFRAWHGGDTTSGSKNPRSELREMSDDGKDEASWSSTKGNHTMTVSGQVNRLTKVKPQTVIAQIHDDSDDISVWRVEADKLWLTKGDTTHGYLVDPNFTLGKPYTLRYAVSGGVISYTYNGAVVPFTLKVKGSGWYFKTGVYLQSNPSTAPTESTSEYTEAVVRSVVVTHS